MNQRFSIRYLAGGDSVFGPNFGHAEAYTLVAPGYLERCANVGRLLKQLKFSTSMESEVMDEIHSRGLDPAMAARLWLSRHPEVPSAWLNGVVSVKGASAAQPRSPNSVAAAYYRIADRLDGANEWIVNHKIPVGTWIGSGVHFATWHAQDLFDELSHRLGWVIGTLTAILLDIPPLVLIGILALGTFMLHRTVALPIFTALSLLLILNLGYWEATTQTLLLVLFATFISVMIGVPLGVSTAHRPWLYNIVRPLLDLMQTVPTFVYLIPSLILFGLGVVPGLISTVIFAAPAPIRLTYVGIDAVPKHMKEVGLAFGATPLQILLKVELPYAMPWIREGITQCIMLSLSMVVVAALVGADGLGKPVVRALNSVNIAMGFEAGLAIVIVAVILDRVCKRTRMPETRR
jgi:glycine betaine/proline transport system permease protein